VVALQTVGAAGHVAEPESGLGILELAHGYAELEASSIATTIAMATVVTADYSQCAPVRPKVR
jgi:hypothetical protein